MVVNASLYHQISFWIFLSFTLLGQNVIAVRNSSGWITDTISLSVSIVNTDTIVAFQTDLRLPSNFQILSNTARLGQRSNGHILSLNQIGPNNYRILAFSLNQLAFTGDSGEVFSVDVVLPQQAGIYSAQLANSILSNFHSINVVSGSENGVITVVDNTVPVEVVLFNANPVDGGILLSWSSSSEIRGCYFEIERMIPGSDWDRIINVPASVPGRTGAYYEFSDKIDTKIYSTIYYRLIRIDSDGSRTLVGQAEYNRDEEVTGFRVFQNFPNPANPTTTLVFYSPSQEYFTFKVFSMDGSEIYSVSETCKAGYNQISWDGKDISGNSLVSGVYAYSIKIKENSFVNKLILLK